ncbi:Signal recognition particle protein, partial [Haemophilus influenzae]
LNPLAWIFFHRMLNKTPLILLKRHLLMQN